VTVRFWQGVAFLELDELTEIARISDAAGYHGMMVSDHLFYPDNLSSPYPYAVDGAPAWSPDTPWPDPWVLIGALGAVTTRLRFATNIYVAASRHPIVTAKAVATAAVLSHNRVALGVGAGWMREEFEVLGTDFGTRGRRLDELVSVLRALWAGGMVEHHGRDYDFDRLEISPVPSAPVPVWGGGHSDAALRRAARLDGWIGNAYTPDDAIAHLDRLAAFRRDAGTADRGDYETIIGLLARPDLDLYRRFADLGVTGMLCAPWITARSGGGGGATAAVANRSAALDAKRAAIEDFAERFVLPLAD
jgi:probable F420-dependent oxidoreductase